MLPDNFESALYLPFNNSSLRAEFEFLTPDADHLCSDLGSFGVWLVLRGNYLLLDETTGELLASLPAQVNSEFESLFIGRWRGQACRVAVYPKDVALPDGVVAVDVMADDPQLSISLLSLATLARQLWRWHRHSCYCSNCGGLMDYVAGEWGRKCRQCHMIHYPHVHPCMIVLITRGDEVLLTRKSNWVAGRYGLVAGFMEPGECLEETVAREVMEETGITVKNLRYVGSQAWPFPSQLMLGFTAEYDAGDIVVDHSELEDARWFNRNELPLLPSKRSIARFLLDNYLK